jgi:DNA-directed RNA polymerase subunit RPC12/RpoP
MEYVTKNPKKPKDIRPIKCPDCGSKDLIFTPKIKETGQDQAVRCKCGWVGYPQWPVEEVA